VTSKLVDYAFRDQIAHITMSNGERGNPISAAFVQQLHAAVTQARTDNAQVIMLTSTGRFFCVGGDLSAFGTETDLPVYLDDLANALHRVVTELLRSDAIVVSVVQGPAAGAGFPLAVAADIVLAGRSARFSLGYTKVGLSVDGGTSLLTHSLGLHRMMALALLNDTLTAEDAMQAGLVARVFDDAELTAESEKLVTTLAQGPRSAQAATKRLLRDTADPAPERALRAETAAIRREAGSHDGHEGVRAFLDKRAPQFGRP
jgi:2-(1,2-epoxy-1,2-dihydrophenyl)acetyl-CoA isomerase